MILILVVYFLFNRGAVLGLSFPVHPTTWSCLPIVMIALSMIKKSNSGLIASSILLMSCKEEFPFATLFLGLCLLFVNKNKISGYTITLMSIGWLIFIFWGRTLIWTGDTIGYGKDLLNSFFANPITKIFGSFTGKGGQRFVEWLLPLFIIMFPLAIKDKPNIIHSNKFIKIKTSLIYTYLRNFDYTFIIMILPILAIRIITGSSNYWEHHYVAPLSALLGGFIITNYNRFHVSKKKVIIFVTILLLLNAEDLLKIPNVKSDIAIKKVPLAEMIDRRSDLKKAADIASTFEDDEVFTMVNLANLLHRNKYVFFASGVFLNYKNLKDSDSSKYQILFVEKKPLGNIYNKNHQYFRQLIVKWQTEGEILMETDKLFLGRKKREDDPLSFLDLEKNGIIK